MRDAERRLRLDCLSMAQELRVYAGDLVAPPSPAEVVARAEAYYAWLAPTALGYGDAAMRVDQSGMVVAAAEQNGVARDDTVFAFTPPDQVLYPPYLNLTSRPDGDLQVTVRSPHDEGGGVGPTGSMRLPRAEAKVLCRALVRDCLLLSD